MTTKQQRDEWRKLAEKATVGPWYVDPLDVGEAALRIREPCGYTEALLAPCDAAFIAAARTAVPALLDEVERLTRERDEARQVVADMAKMQADIDDAKRLLEER